MNFLESAVILVPALAGITLSVYNGDSNILTEFEQKYCFSPNMQKIFTAAELKSFLENSSDEFIYEIIEPLESHLILFKIDYQWILLGPYVEDGWDEPSARSLLARLGAFETMISPYHSYRCKLPISQQDYAVKIAFLIIEHMTGNGSIQKVKTVHTASESQTSAPFF